MSSSKAAYGATLLELMVVMTIMMTLLGLVGGLSVDSVDRAAAQTEIISLYGVLKKASARAFSSGRKVFVELSGPRVEVYSGSELRSSTVFSHLQFDDQVVRFDRNGIADTVLIKVSMRGEDRSLDLRPVVSSSVDVHYQRGEGFEG